MSARIILRIIDTGTDFLLIHAIGKFTVFIQRIARVQY
jgi:hypothetical protein